MPQPVLRKAARETRFGVIYFGSTSPAMDEAFDALQAQGVHVDTLRVRAFPFSAAVDRFIAEHETVFVVEQNRDAQLRMMLINEQEIDPARLEPILHYDGTPITARFIIEAIAKRVRADNVEPIRAKTQGKGRGMTYLAKPKLHHPTLPSNKLGFTRRDYEGKISTLCAGCGHDSISAALVQACWELDIEPHRVAKLSGIGCSSKTPDYFLGASHGFNTVHGRMPSVLTGANLANRELLYLGVSGDGDSASIGLGQFAHAMRRGVNMTYIVENNGVYGLTKGQFSATADQGSKSKKGVVNSDTAIDLVGDGAAARRELRRAQLLRRQGAARAADQGRAQPPRRGLPRRHQPVRRLQQPPGQHQELRLRARAQRSGQPARLHAAPRRDHRDVRAGRGDRGDPARRQRPAPAQARRGLRPGRPARGDEPHRRARGARRDR